VTNKYQPGYAGDLRGWRQASLPVAIDLEHPQGLTSNPSDRVAIRIAVLACRDTAARALVAGGRTAVGRLGSRRRSEYTKVPMAAPPATGDTPQNRRAKLPACAGNARPALTGGP
jgi:hypothetical protein